MSATSLLGGVRTYAHLGNRPFTYENWMHAIRVGNTFVTVGPLGAFRVEGVSPGGQVRLPADGGTVNVIWQVESASLPVDQVEVVMDGMVVDQVNCDKVLRVAGSTAVNIKGSTTTGMCIEAIERIPARARQAVSDK